MTGVGVQVITGARIVEPECSCASAASGLLAKPGTPQRSPGSRGQGTQGRTQDFLKGRARQ